MDLLEQLFRTLEPHERILIFLKNPNERFLFSTVEEAKTFATRESQKGRDAYFGVAVRKNNVADTNSISRVTSLLADVDEKDFGSVEGLEEALCSFPIPWSFRVNSGHGCHLYWCLTSSISKEKAGVYLKKIWTALGEPASGRTYYPECVLRVPNTTNYKDLRNPCPVQMGKCFPGLKYDLKDIDAIQHIPPKYARRLYTDSHKGYPSRSERDFAVIKSLIAAGVSESCIVNLMTNLPVGNRASKDPAYLKRTIVAASKSKSISKAFFTVNEGKTYINTKDACQLLATFSFDPERLLKGSDKDEEDHIVGTLQTTDNVYKGVIFPKSAFSSSSKLIMKLNKASWSWLGTDYQTRRYLVFLMDQLKKKGSPQAIGTYVVGRHDGFWVTPVQVFDSKKEYQLKEAPFVHMKTGRDTPELNYSFIPDDAYAFLVKEISESLAEVNNPSALVSIVGWFMASSLKPLFDALDVRFPILNIHGTQGAGKTRTVTAIMQPLLGVAKPRVYPARTKTFVILSLLSSTNTIPVSFGEYRDIGLQVDDFLNILRRSYDAGYDSRGRADQTTQMYHLTAPVTVDGEDPFRDPATRERSIIVNLHPEDIRRRTNAYKAFKKLTKLNLTDFAGPYIQKTLLETPMSIEKRWEDNLNTLDNILPEFIPDRVRQNYAVVLTGLEMYNEHISSYGGVTIPWNSNTFAELLSYDLNKKDSGRPKIYLDDFAEDVINYLDIHWLEPRFFFYYENMSGILWISLPGAYSWWRAFRRSQGKTIVTRESLMAQIEELFEIYTVPSAIVKTSDGVTRDCIGLRVHICANEGLNVPNKIKNYIQDDVIVERE